ncbi:hypothetical protein MNBD_GAMMA22-2612 [hydrothermal vent metagenome]|uniref:Uncharacterized protein n=1 Tax=hydrothermal vent metagenome TaxID=652676 RepID=A0A3B0ZUI3_9ZZZZ
MNAITAVQNFSLTMNRNFKAFQEQVYMAWTNKEGKSMGINVMALSRVK